MNPDLPFEIITIIIGFAVDSLLGTISYAKSDKARLSQAALKAIACVREAINEQVRLQVLQHHDHVYEHSQMLQAKPCEAGHSVSFSKLCIACQELDEEYQRIEGVVRRLETTVSNVERIKEVQGWIDVRHIDHIFWVSALG